MFAAYGVVVPLPVAENDRLGRWATETPGATWPAWGGHVTLLPAIEVGARHDELASRVDEVARQTEPFPVVISQVAAKPHALSPVDWTVQLLVGDPTPLRDLRSALWRALDPVGVDLFPDAREDWYEFHVSLLGRGSQADAAGVAAAATAAGLAIEFTANSVALVAHPAAGEESYRVTRQLALGSRA